LTGAEAERALIEAEEPDEHLLFPVQNTRADAGHRRITR
jgi:hypothetical protein